MNTNTDHHNIDTFGITCWPGPSATASTYEISRGRPALFLYLDPISIVITVPTDPFGRRHMATLCRQLARTAEQLADTLDPEST